MLAEYVCTRTPWVAGGGRGGVALREGGQRVREASKWKGKKGKGERKRGGCCVGGRKVRDHAGRVLVKQGVSL